ncbi:MAG: Hpt domain-containing protein [Solirubrobacterales bacterium]
MAEPFEKEPALSSASSTPAVDRGAVRQLEEQLGKEGLTELVTVFLDRTPDRLANLRKTVLAGDALSLREAARSLEGTARSFGAAEMGELAAQIEEDAAVGSLNRADELVAVLAASFDRTRAELGQQLRLGTGGAGSRSGSPPQSPEARIAELEHRVASLEQSVAGLLSR